MPGKGWRNLLYSLAAVPLAWSLWLLSGLLLPVQRALTTSGQSLLVKRLLLIAVDPVLLALVYLLGCWLVWRHSLTKKTWLRWLAAALAAAQLLVLLSTLAMVFLTPPGAAIDGLLTDVRLWSGWLLPPALTMLAFAVLAEPYTTARLPWRANATAWTLAAVAVGAWALTATDSAPWWYRIALDIPHEVSIWPVQLAYLGSAGLLASAGMPTAVAVPVSQVVWVAGFWYVVSRTALALITQRTNAQPGT